jgi:DNA-binding CsgD family transcriptional regulator
VTDAGWPALFSAAFFQSRNAMALLDARRMLVEVNGAYLRLLDEHRDRILGRPVATFVSGGPLYSQAAWERELARGRATGEAWMLRPDGSTVGVQWAMTAADTSGRRLALFVALSTSLWGRRFRRETPAGSTERELTPRELEIVRLIAAGETAAEIGADLQLSQHTVRTHIRNAMDKVGARSRAQLVAKAIGQGVALG